MTIYVLCGIPASGKSTLSQSLSEQLNLKLYCYDEYKKETKPTDNEKAHQRIFNEIKKDLLSGQDVILDDLHLVLEWRTALLSSLKDIECKKMLIVVQTPIEVCIERDKTRKSHTLGEGVIRHLNNRYCPPSLDEGWDEIIVINNDEDKENK